MARPSDRPEKHQPPTEVLAGASERIIFQNPCNGFCVLRIKARGGCGSRSLNIALQNLLNPDPALVIPLLTLHYATRQRNLVGQLKALAVAVKNHLGRRRCTRLAEWMGGSAACSVSAG